MNLPYESCVLHELSGLYLRSENPWEGHYEFVKETLRAINLLKSDLSFSASNTHTALMKSMEQDTPEEFMTLVHRLSCGYSF